MSLSRLSHDTREERHSRILWETDGRSVSEHPSKEEARGKGGGSSQIDGGNVQIGGGDEQIGGVANTQTKRAQSGSKKGGAQVVPPARKVVPQLVKMRWSRRRQRKTRSKK